MSDSGSVVHFRSYLPWLFAMVTLVGCWLLSLAVRRPVPRIHDEFSYMLMGETFARGHVTNPSPPLPEFFDTFHVLVRPAYVSKYFPVQGIFVAIGQKLGGHPEIGAWLSSALACAAVAWMLQAWITPGWALLGASLVAVQYGIYSYWSQTYWGGMGTALGGALFFGALRRLWDRFCWSNSLWLALALLVLANSRPLEGALAALPAILVLTYQIFKSRRWSEVGFWSQFVLPSLGVLALGAFATGSYNHAITGSALKPPYVVHEEQYQESPPFIFLQKRPPLTYSSVWLRYYYEFQELHTYDMQRSPLAWVLAIARKMNIWWAFYCGPLLTIPLFLPGLLQKGRARLLQAIFLAGVLILPLISDHKVAWRILIDVLVLFEVGVLWFVFKDFWSRLAIGTGSLLILEIFVAKWPFPHYFAPAACLVWYLQTEGLRRIWDWNHQPQPESELTRTERKAALRGRPKRVINLRPVVYALPALCVISLAVRIADRLNGKNSDPHGPDRGTLLLNDWSVRRSELDHWLEQQTSAQLVFVRYSRWHNVNDEWVYNHPDIMASHVIWARDLGAEHNRLLLDLAKDRTVWLLEADRREAQLVPYAETLSSPVAPNQDDPAMREVPPNEGEQD